MEIESSVIAGGFVSMGGAVAALWVFIRQTMKHTQKKLDECEVKHDARTEDYIELAETVHKLKGAGEMADVVTTSINNLVEAMHAKDKEQPK